MKTEQELDYDILKITRTIDLLFPHLSKYLGEKPVLISDALRPEINIENLTNYCLSLDTFLKHCIRYHYENGKSLTF